MGLSYYSIILKKMAMFRFVVTKQTVDPILQVDKYPIQNINNLYSKVSGVRYFSKLHLCNTYFQIPLNRFTEANHYKYV